MILATSGCEIGSESRVVACMVLELLSYGLLTFVLIDIDSWNCTVIALTSTIEPIVKIHMPLTTFATLHPGAHNILWTSHVAIRVP